MPFSERVEEMDREIRDAVARAIAQLREELTERVRRGQEELLLGLQDFEPALPDEVVSLSELGPLAAENEATARRGAFSELRDGLAALDRARSQSEILSALLAATGRYASRALLLLTRGDEARGWGGRAFGDEQTIRALALPLGADGPWAALAGGHGTVALSAADCAAVCSRLEAELPRDGVLVPLVLRDLVAAALYADRIAGDELLVEALQTLVYAASQAIESLPFRERGSTPTLRVAAVEAAPEPPAVGVWPAAAGAAAAVEVEEEPAAPPAEEPPAVETPPVEEPPAAEAPPVEEPPIGSPPSVEEPPPVEEPEAAAPAAEPPATPAEAAPVWGAPIEEEEDTAAALDDTAAMTGSPLEDAAAGGWRLEEEPETEVAVEPAPAAWPPATQAPAWGAPAEEAPVWGAPIEEPPAWGTPIEEPEAWGAPLDEPAAEPAAAGWAAETAAVPTVADWRAAPTADWRAPAAEVPAETAPEPEPEETTARIPHLQPSDTVMLRTDAWGAPPESPPAAPPPAPPPAADVDAPGVPAQTVRMSSLGPEVTPPTGVQGPGWAFATTRLQVAPDEEARHDEARRLARLLVSEIKLYNEEQVEEGRRNRDLYERLKEDIDRSRQMYEERVDQRILNTTDYFYQELVRILAAGDSRALGI